MIGLFRSGHPGYDHSLLAAVRLSNIRCLRVVRHLPFVRRLPISRKSSHCGRNVGLGEQLALFSNSSGEPEGLRYAADFVSPGTERELIGRIAALPLKPFQ